MARTAAAPAAAPAGDEAPKQRKHKQKKPARDTADQPPAKRTKKHHHKASNHDGTDAKHAGKHEKHEKYEKHEKHEKREKREKRPDSEKPARVLRRAERRDLLNSAKTVWEKLRPRTVQDDKARALVAELHALLQGRVHTLIFQHEGSRMVQYLLTNASRATRDAIVTELRAHSDEAVAAAAREKKEDGGGGGAAAQPLVLRMAADRYARHLIAKLLRVASPETRALFEAQLLAAAPDLLRNATAAQTLDLALQSASAATRARVAVRTLLARAPGVSDAKSADGTPSDDGFATVDEAVKALPKEFRAAAADRAAEVALALVEKGGDSLRLRALHAALAAWTRYAVQTGDATRVRALGVAAASELSALCGSRDGAYVAVTLVKALDAKHRKAVVKAMRPHVRDLAFSEHGHRFVIAVLEFTDDTRLTSKSVCTELCYKSGAKVVGGDDGAEEEGDGNADGGDGGKKGAMSKAKRGGRSRAEKKREDGKQPGTGGEEGADEDEDADDVETGVDVVGVTRLCENRFGRAVLLCILVGRDSRYFNPQEYAEVWAALPAEAFGVTSKKAAETRRGELRDAVETAVVEVVRSRQERLLQHVLGGAVVVVSAGLDSTREAVADGVAEWHSRASEVLESRTAQRGFAAVLKVGGAGVARMMVDKCGDALATALAEVKPMGEQLGKRLTELSGADSSSE